MIAPKYARPTFQPGQLVRHRRHGYRGVVVDYDPYCKAPDAWYGNNRTQPERDQPWYHVFMHDTGAVTYAAQTSLIEDPSGEPIEHPLLDEFFTEFTGEAYLRNERAWQGW